MSVIMGVQVSVRRIRGKSKRGVVSSSAVDTGMRRCGLLPVLWRVGKFGDRCDDTMMACIACVGSEGWCDTVCCGAITLRCRNVSTVPCDTGWCHRSNGRDGRCHGEGEVGN